eukprot:m.222823 g.222823  ORF g.222823 m.222823 type:complete len:224 (-) comp16113_c0_seq1:28-699(-)
MPGISLGETFPDFECDSSVGPLRLHEYFGEGWGLLCSHPADFTPVCTTELGYLAKILPELTKRNVKVLGLSCNDAESHHGWIKDIQATAELAGEFPYPIIADPKRELAVKLGMLDPVEKDAAGIPLTARAVFIVGPDKKLKLSILYPATTGRNFDEILRVIDSLQLTAYHKVATPANWKQGGACMVVPSVKPEEHAALFPKGVDVKAVPSGKQYLRFTPQPNV